MRWWRWAQARAEKAMGSGNVPAMKAPTSTQSGHSFSSHTPGMRMGKWSL